MPEDRANSFLQMIRRSQRGRLKVYLGYGPGVGKTYLMLLEAHRLKAEGVDVVIGLVETHGRANTAKLADGLPQIERRRVEYRGIVVEEMDVDAVLSRRPQVCLVDELAHSNVPGSRNPKRYQDVQELLAAGIHVILGTERVTDRGLQISACVIDADGAIAGWQDKGQLDPSEEAIYPALGTERRVFTAGPLTFGVVICHEGWRYPETVRWAVRRGAQVVFHPHAHVAEPGSDRPATFDACLSVAEQADLTFAQFVMLTPFPGTLDFAAWEKSLGPDPQKVDGIPVSRHWLIPQDRRPKVYMDHPVMAPDEIRWRTQHVWDRFYSFASIWRRAAAVKSLKGRLAFVLISKIYRQMYANTGIATDSARVNRSARWAR